MSFNGKAVIVTGSSAGIGQECAVLFGEQGAFVTVHGMSIDGINTTIKRLQEAGVPDSHYQYVQGPIEDEKVQNELIEKTVKKFGRIDVLVNNAGTNQKPGVEAASLENLDYVLTVNLRSVISLTRKSLGYLTKTHGNIVNIGSISADMCFPPVEHYAASKAALSNYTRNAALQYAPKNIRINLVSPGSIYTNIRLRHSTKAEVDALYESRHEAIPLKRTGTGREVAYVVEFLASDKASYVTGSNYVVDGGALLMKPF